MPASPPLPRIEIATGNSHKVQEIREILRGIAEVAAVSTMPEVEESAPDFVGNARLKALAIDSPEPQTWILADDSGLEVEALGGAPGVHTARFAGPNATDAANRAKLLAELARVDAKNPASRRARFRCVLALARAGAVVAEFDGSCEGFIAPEERGDGGFGYDPLFIPAQPPGNSLTFAELDSETKHALSHRGRALAALRDWLATTLPA